MPGFWSQSDPWLGGASRLLWGWGPGAAGRDLGAEAWFGEKAVAGNAADRGFPHPYDGERENRAFVGRLQVRTVRDPTSVSWLCWLVADANSTESVSIFTPLLFRRLLDKALAFLGASELGITSASVRAGEQQLKSNRGFPYQT